MNGVFQKIILFAFIVLFFSSAAICQSSSELIQNGLNSYQNGNYEAALNSFSSSLGNTGDAEQQEENVLPLTSESQTEYTGESQEVNDSESKIELDQESKETYTGESQIDLDTQSKIQQYSDPLNYQGEDQSDIYLYMGQTYLKMGNQQAALNAFDKSISLDPSNTDAYFRRAVANYQVNPDKVCPDLKIAIEQGHQSAQELFNLICK